MKRMYGEAGIVTDNRNIVNHSGRVTCCTRLFNYGFDEQMTTARHDVSRGLFLSLCNVSL